MCICSFTAKSRNNPKSQLNTRAAQIIKAIVTERAAEARTRVVGVIRFPKSKRIVPKAGRTADLFRFPERIAHRRRIAWSGGATIAPNRERRTAKDAH